MELIIGYVRNEFHFYGIESKQIDFSTNRVIVSLHLGIGTVTLPFQTTK